MPLSEYLAKKYLNSSNSSIQSKSKTKKRKHDKIIESKGLEIEEDDITGWEDDLKNSDEENENGEFKPTIVQGKKPKKEIRWKNIKNEITTNINEIKKEIPTSTTTPKFGLYTSEEYEELTNLNDLKLKQTKLKSKPKIETIYRDATNRRININSKKSQVEEEIKLNKKQEIEKQIQNSNFQKGFIQEVNKQKLNEELNQLKLKPLGRTKNDKELNDSLKNKLFFNDPALEFLENTDKHVNSSRSITGKKLYTGISPANRFGITPGYKWDGVDRSNGFEQYYFDKINEKKQKKDVSYAMEMDV